MESKLLCAYCTALYMISKPNCASWAALYTISKTLRFLRCAFLKKEKMPTSAICINLTEKKCFGQRLSATRVRIKFSNFNLLLIADKKSYYKKLILQLLKAISI